MKILFLIGAPHIGGGMSVILHHAWHLADRGCEVTIASDQPITQESFAWHPLDLSRIKIAQLASLSAESSAAETSSAGSFARAEVFDIAFATWWRTVYDLHRVNAKRYAYLVQSIESRFFPWHDYAEQSFAEATYSFDLPSVTVADWIHEYLRENFEHDALIVKNGISKRIFTNDGAAVAPRIPGKLRVLVEGPLGVFYKNVEKTLALCRSSAASEVWLLTNTQGVSSHPDADRVFCCVPQSKTPEIYRSCDVLVKLSYVEGMFGPPLEMFHCGGTAVTYEVTGAEEYLVHGENSFVIARDDEAAVIAALNSLATDSALLQRLKNGAADTTAHWPDWSSPSQKLYEALPSLAAKSSETRATLAAKARVFSNWFAHHYEQQRGFYEVQGARDHWEREAKALRSELVATRSELEEKRALLDLILNSSSFRFMQSLRSVPLVGGVAKQSISAIRRILAPRVPINPRS